MTVEGSLDMFQLPEILQVVAQQQKTGILTVQGERDIIAVSFLKGGVVGADSLNQTGDEGLVAVLQRKGYGSTDQLHKLQREGERTGRSLQEMLLERKVLDQSQLLDALRSHYMELLGHLLSWREGDFKFYGNDEVSYEEGLSPISVQDILLSQLADDDPAAQAPRRKPPPQRADPPAPSPPPQKTTGTLPEIPDLLSDSLPSLGAPAAPPAKKREESKRPETTPAAGPKAPGTSRPPRPPAEPGRSPVPRAESEPPELAPVYRRLPSSRPIKVRTSGAGGFDEGFIVLSLVEQRVLQQVDGERTLGQIVRDLDLSPEEGVAAARRLESLRLLRPAGPTGEMPSGLDLPEAVIGGDALDEDEDEQAAPRSWEELEGVIGWVSRGLACVGALLLAWSFLGHPQGALLPFPWQDGQRATLEKQQRRAGFLKIDRGVKTFVLMMGRFPTSLTELTDLRLLGPSDLQTPGGLPLKYEASDLQYSVTPTRDGQPLEELSAKEAITGNFLLDYDFFSVAKGPSDLPVILLD